MFDSASTDDVSARYQASDLVMVHGLLRTWVDSRIASNIPIPQGGGSSHRFSGMLVRVHSAGSVSQLTWYENLVRSAQRIETKIRSAIGHQTCSFCLALRNIKQTGGENTRILLRISKPRLTQRGNQNIPLDLRTVGCDLRLRIENHPLPPLCRICH